MMKALSAFIFASCVVAVPASVSAANATLHGSHGSMERQNHIASVNDFSFLRSASDIRHLVDLGLLVPVADNANYRLADVSYPYTRPSTATFIQRLGSQYHDACGERMVVTSLTRPLDEQPRNASPLSVHPTGMAVDLRVPATTTCRTWLIDALLGLENKGVLDVTREYHPPHLHVALFPQRYLAYAAPFIARDSALAAAQAQQAAARAALANAAKPADHHAADVTTAGLANGHGWLESIPVLAIVLAALSAAAARRRDQKRPSSSN